MVTIVAEKERFKSTPTLGLNEGTQAQRSRRRTFGKVTLEQKVPDLTSRRKPSVAAGTARFTVQAALLDSNDEHAPNYQYTCCTTIKNSGDMGL